MNRFKKELRKQGVKLENDYPWLPFDMGSVTLETVSVNSELCTVTKYFTSIVCVDHYNRQMELEYTTILE